MSKQPYKLYRDSYVDRSSGQRRSSPNHHVRFRDHLRRRQTLVAEAGLEASVALANRIMQLIECRRHCVTPDPTLLRWLQSQPPSRVGRLQQMDLVERHWVRGEAQLRHYLCGGDDVDGLDDVLEGKPTFEQALQARGGSPRHIANVIRNVRNVINAVGLGRVEDALTPGTDARINIHLGRRRAAGEIGGTTFNYIVRDLKSFGRWLRRTGAAPRDLFEGVERAANAEVDVVHRRALSTAELRELLASLAGATDVHHALVASDRAILYWFAYATGLRPRAIASLTVGSFYLSSANPLVVTAASANKRGVRHEQPLMADLAAALRDRFRGKPPATRAFVMPHDPAEMLRMDIAAARSRWIAAAASDAERAERETSDFLLACNHRGERVCFYSLRHTFGTILADAGVAQKDIAAAMHHVTTRSTERYLHSSRNNVRAAVDRLPSVSLPADATL